MIVRSIYHVFDYICLLVPWVDWKKIPVRGLVNFSASFLSGVLNNSWKGIHLFVRPSFRGLLIDRTNVLCSIRTDCWRVDESLQCYVNMFPKLHESCIIETHCKNRLIIIRKKGEDVGIRSTARQHQTLFTLYDVRTSNPYHVPRTLFRVIVEYYLRIVILCDVQYALKSVILSSSLHETLSDVATTEQYLCSKFTKLNNWTEKHLTECFFEYWASKVLSLNDMSQKRVQITKGIP